MSQFAHGIRHFEPTSIDQGEVEPSFVLGQVHETSVTLQQHLESIIWLTYRKDFPQMVPYEYTSDAGWGCMLRTGQMLLCEALIRNQTSTKQKTNRFHWSEKIHPSIVTILKRFVDTPSNECFYSIHELVRIGMRYDMLPGEWYGPTTAAQVLRDLVNQHSFYSNMTMYVPHDGVIYSDDVNKLCAVRSSIFNTQNDQTSHLPSSDDKNHSIDSNRSNDVFHDPLLNPPTIDVAADWSKSILILLPLRLGLDTIHETYIPALTKVFEFPQSVGIIGGKRGHSVYFVGAQGHQFYILDPHTVHPATEADASFPSPTHLITVHSTGHLTMDVNYIDPSLAIGFYCKDQQDYLDLCSRIQALSASHSCPFSVADRCPDYTNDVDLHSLSSDSNMDGNNSEEDEYVLI